MWTVENQKNQHLTSSCEVRHQNRVKAIISLPEIHELLQNADDCSYSSDQVPTIQFWLGEKNGSAFFAAESNDGFHSGDSPLCEGGPIDLRGPPESQQQFVLCQEFGLLPLIFPLLFAFASLQFPRPSASPTPL